MKRLITLLFLTSYLSASGQQNYLFFLHNMYLELYGTEGVHPEYGKAEYNEIIDKFRKEGLIVISELRPKGTDGNIYASKVVRQIDSLIKTGVSPSHITVAGTSKGGYIAMYTSGILKKSDVNYVLIGCCGAQSVADDDIHLYGNILSIYENSDAYGSCQNTKMKPGSDVKHFKEIELHTGLKHGFLYKASDGWIKPTATWAKQDYK